MQTKHICVLINIWTKGEVGAPLNRFKPSSKIFYWPFQGGTSFVDILCFFLSCVCYAFARVCLYVPCGHLLGKGWPLGSRLWYLTVRIGILGQVWYLIVSIPGLCTLTYFEGWGNITKRHLFNKTIVKIHENFGPISSSSLLWTCRT